MSVLLLDLDGVIFDTGELIDGAVETIDWLHREQIPFRFVTNTTSRPRLQLVAELGAMGIPVEGEEVFTPAVQARHWLQQHGIRRAAFHVSEALRGEFPDLEATEPGAPTEALIVGTLRYGWDSARLNQAFQALMQTPRPAFLALGKPRYWQVGDALQLDSGPFVVALEYATGQNAIVLGKPAPEFFLAALDTLDASPDQAVMVGDDLRGDVEGGQNAGLRGVLVRTGKFRPSDLEQDVTPDGVLDSIAALPEWWQAHCP